jgi:RHS repeat-associated protein
VVDANGNVSERSYYDPWGERINSDGTLAQSSKSSVNKGFTGQEHDDAFGLVNFKGRMYDPAMKRFLSADPIVSAPLFSQSWNPYSYVMNSPLNLADPSGYASVYCVGQYCKDGAIVADEVVVTPKDPSHDELVKQAQAFLAASAAEFDARADKVREGQRSRADDAGSFVNDGTIGPTRRNEALSDGGRPVRNVFAEMQRDTWNQWYHTSGPEKAISFLPLVAASGALAIPTAINDIPNLPWLFYAALKHAAYRDTWGSLGLLLAATSAVSTGSAMLKGMGGSTAKVLNGAKDIPGVSEGISNSAEEVINTRGIPLSDVHGVAGRDLVLIYDRATGEVDVVAHGSVSTVSGMGPQDLATTIRDTISDPISAVHVRACNTGCRSYISELAAAMGAPAKGYISTTLTVGSEEMMPDSFDAMTQTWIPAQVRVAAP